LYAPLDAARPNSRISPGGVPHVRRNSRSGKWLAPGDVYLCAAKTFLAFCRKGIINVDVRVQNIVTLMRRDLRAKLTLNDMARAVNLTSFHFCHLFKAETGSSPAKYLKALRLERARELLETTFLSTKEIRALVGLNDESHFARDFRAVYGLTPQQHREHYLGLPTRKKDDIERSKTNS
jgi:AraC-like DNA-binding protein